MTYEIRKAAVLGAGTMGAAIAAHLANVGIPSFLLDIVPSSLSDDEQKRGLSLADTEVRNRIARQGLERCLKARPSNLYHPDLARLIHVGNLEDNFAWVGEADWVIEAVVERLEVKQPLMARIDQVRQPETIVSTNTSGIPVGTIAEGRSSGFRTNFLGTHFFNPPRYLQLLELIPTGDTDPELVGFLRRFCEDRLGKGVVVCKDTPNFIANRILSVVGSIGINYALAEGYTVEEVDALTGPAIGRPKTATFRLNDLVGIDVLAHVSENLYRAISGDPYREVLVDERAAGVIGKMVERGWLGNKTDVGFYKKVEADGQREFWPLDLKGLDHRPPALPFAHHCAGHRGGCTTHRPAGLCRRPRRCVPVAHFVAIGRLRRRLHSRDQRRHPLDRSGLPLGLLVGARTLRNLGCARFASLCGETAQRTCGHSRLG